MSPVMHPYRLSMMFGLLPGDFTAHRKCKACLPQAQLIGCMPAQQRPHGLWQLPETLPHLLLIRRMRIEIPREGALEQCLRRRGVVHDAGPHAQVMLAVSQYKV